MSSTRGTRASPFSVSAYSTRGGTSGKVWRSTIPSSSRARKRSERVRGLIPFSERSSSQKRLEPSARSRMTRRVHLPQTTSAVRQTGQLALDAALIAWARRDRVDCVECLASTSVAASLHLLKFWARAWDGSVLAGRDGFDLEHVDLVADALGAVDEGDGQAGVDFEQLAGTGAREAVAFAEDGGDVVGDQEQRLAGLGADPHIGDNLGLFARQRSRRKDPVPHGRLARLLAAVGLSFAAGDLDIGCEAVQRQIGLGAGAARGFVGRVRGHGRRRAVLLLDRLRRRGRGGHGRGARFAFFPSAELRTRQLGRGEALFEGVGRAAAL